MKILWNFAIQNISKKTKIDSYKEEKKTLLSYRNVDVAVRLDSNCEKLEKL